MDALKARAAGLFGHTLHVEHVEQLSPNLRRIVFEGSGILGLPFAPGMKIKLGVAGVLRSYTPCDVDLQRGRMAVVFHLHGRGVAADWAAGARPGDKATFLGPARSMPDAAEAPWGLFFGDETTLGLAAALLTEPSREVGGAVELASEDLAALPRLGLTLRAVPRGATHGTSLLACAQQVELPDGDGVIWLSGHAGTVIELSRHFLNRGVPRSRVLIRPYWSDRGTAHRKAVARQLSS